MVINGDTLKAASLQKRNLWEECRKKHSIILMGPEQLQSPEFRHLVSSKEFVARVCRLGIDEVHLIYTWGASQFRRAFLDLGFIRTRLPAINGELIPLIAVSATIREGQSKKTICNTLGLSAGQYHLLRRSNLRPDIQIIVREMVSPISGVLFPELEWVLDDDSNTVIFCKTIGLGFRVAAYLWRRAIAKGSTELSSRLRLFNSLNAQSFNEETLGFLNENKRASITIATDVLSVGWDSPFTKTVVVFGEPDDIDEFVQKIGRAGRNKTMVPHPRAFLYHSKGALSTTAKQGPLADTSVTDFLLATCKLANLNQQYNNPATDDPCSCSRCLELAPVTAFECQCSGCAPESQEHNSVRERVSTKPRARPGQGISKAMKELASRQFTLIRDQIFRDADSVANSFLPPHVFLSDLIINKLTDHIYSITTKDHIADLISDQPLLEPYHQVLFDCCQQLLVSFEDIREQEKAARAAKKKGKQPAVDESQQEEVLEDVGIVVDKEDGDAIEGHDLVGPGLKWKINFKTNEFSVV